MAIERVTEETDLAGVVYVTKTDADTDELISFGPRPFEQQPVAGRRYLEAKLAGELFIQAREWRDLMESIDQTYWDEQLCPGAGLDPGSGSMNDYLWTSQTAYKLAAAEWLRRLKLWRAEL